MKDKILEYDKNFDESIFLTRVDHIFIMILSAIMDNDMNSVRHYLSEDLCSKYDELVNKYKQSNKIRLFDEMNVKSTMIHDVEISNNRINITVKLTSRYMDYFVDNDGNYISGINDHRVEKDHYIVFSKRLDASELESARRCPNCGNTLDINASGVCPYCKGIFNTEKYDYIVTRMELV